MTPQPDELGPLCRVGAVVRWLWRQMLAGTESRTSSKPRGHPLNDQRKALDWGRLLHLSQKERMLTIGRQEETELRNLRNQQRDLKQRPLVEWLLRDGWR